MSTAHLHRLVEQWFLSLIPAPQSVEEQKVSKQLYRLLADGTPVSREHLATSLGLSIATVNKALHEFPRGTLGLMNRGESLSLVG